MRVTSSPYGEAKMLFCTEVCIQVLVGLFSGLYKKRWEMFIDDAGRILKTGTEFNQKVFDERIKEWEWKWVNGNEIYPDTPTGRSHCGFDGNVQKICRQNCERIQRQSRTIEQITRPTIIEK